MMRLKINCLQRTLEVLENYRKIEVSLFKVSYPINPVHPPKFRFRLFHLFLIQPAVNPAKPPTNAPTNAVTTISNI